MPIFSLQTLYRGVPRDERPAKANHRWLINAPSSCAKEILDAKGRLEERIGVSLSFSVFVAMAAQAVIQVMKDRSDWTPPLFNKDKTI